MHATAPHSAAFQNNRVNGNAKIPHPRFQAKTNTFLGARYRRIVKRRGKLKALVAVARSILVII